jgi:hypothetical protein
VKQFKKRYLSGKEAANILKKSNMDWFNENKD